MHLISQICSANNNLIKYSSYATFNDIEFSETSAHLVASSVWKVSGRVPSFINFIFVIFSSFRQKVMSNFHFKTMGHALAKKSSNA